MSLFKRSVAMVLCSLLFLAGAVWLGKRLAPRFGNWTATLLAAGTFVIAIGIVMLILPSLGHLSANVREYGSFATETPQPLKDHSGTIVYPGFPADESSGVSVDQSPGDSGVHTHSRKQYVQ